MRHRALCLLPVPLLAALACSPTRVAGTYYAADTSPLGTSIELAKDGSCKLGRDAGAAVPCAYDLNGTQIRVSIAPPVAGLQPEYRGILSMNRKLLMLARVNWERAD